MSDQWDVSKAIGFKLEPYEVKVTNKDMILYALGIGFQKDSLNKDHYNYTYENAANFGAFPTMNVVLAHRGSFETLSIPGVPAFNPMLLLHGEEHLQLFSPLEQDSTVVCQEEVLDVQDKKKAFVLVMQTTITNKDTGELVAKIQTQLFVRSPGGFGHKGTFRIGIPEPPKGVSPHTTSTVATDKNQAFLYRLNGDMNPLHVDPQMSEIAGFKVPILHGLCFFGITAKAVSEKYHKEDPNLMKKFSGRFTGHVFPGETLIVDTWKQGSQIVVQTRTQERGKVVLKGFCELSPQAKL
uniref:Hydroxysteroid 17-beta dehydrogenase 4 n=1 Tax=Strombidium rassoulzadegani TaxID=1082188 RepID=A0A7S3CRL1_9SPIT|mmetsp:Transcript_4773/g.8179  ORF Transcript_4773/g.8179 Transcript_4773/m.8179 type:complete len:296 (+) Transcript_4773:3-890(+)